MAARTPPCGGANRGVSAVSGSLTGEAADGRLAAGCSAVTLADRPCDGRMMQGSSISAVRIERAPHLVPQGGISADQRRSVVRDRIELSTFRFSGGRSYRLSYLTSARCRASAPTAAVLTGFEPATSTLTGWRALQLLYRTLLVEAFLPRSQEHITDTAVVAAPPNALLEGRASCPQRDSNPCRRLERAVS